VGSDIGGTSPVGWKQRVIAVPKLKVGSMLAGIITISSVVASAHWLRSGVKV